jgi:hypothetical protein
MPVERDRNSRTARPFSPKFMNQPMDGLKGTLSKVFLAEDLLDVEYEVAVISLEIVPVLN